MLGSNTEMGLLLNLAAFSSSRLRTYRSLTVCFSICYSDEVTLLKLIFIALTQIKGNGNHEVTFPDHSFNTPSFLEDKLPSAGITENSQARKHFPKNYLQTFLQVLSCKYCLLFAAGLLKLGFIPTIFQPVS